MRASPALALLLLAATAAVAVPGPARAAADANVNLLEQYLGHLQTLRTTFIETLSDPRGHETERSTGTLIVQRPGRFSWDIHPQAAAAPGRDAGSAAGTASAGQLMVSDGTSIWFLDRDLQQVTVKPVDAALSATPAMLLSGAVDLHKSFRITDAGERSGLSWVLIEPNGTQADFRRALFGFAGGELKRLIVEDKLDQTATIIFQSIERNGPVSPAEVSFTPPPGVDVIGSPRR